MANNSQAGTAVGTGDLFNSTDLSTFTAHSSTGKLPGTMLYVGAANTSTAPTSVTNANPLPIGDAGGTLTVDAPVGTPVFVRLSDGTSAISTLPVSIAATVTISGAVTNAGTFVTQENGAALTSLQLIDDVIYVDNAAFTDDASKFALIGGIYQSAPQTITDGRVAPLLLDANGRVVVAAHAVTQSGTWNVGTVTTLTTVTTVSTVTNVATIGTSVTPGTSAAHLGKAEDAPHASADTGVAVLAVRRDSPVVGSDSDGDYSNLNVDASGRVWCNVNNTVTVASHAVTNAGTFAVQSAQSGTWTVQPGNTANTTAWLVNDNPVTTGGLSVSSFLSTAAVQSTAVKASAGQVYAIEFFNIGSTPMYVRLYNQTGAPAGGDNANILWRGVIPGDTTGAGFVKTWDKGIAFSSGIGMRCTGGIADTDTTALAANTVIGNVCYK